MVRVKGHSFCACVLERLFLTYLFKLRDAAIDEAKLQSVVKITALLSSTAQPPWWAPIYQKSNLLLNLSTAEKGLVTCGTSVPGKEL